MFGRILRGALHGVVAGHEQEAEDQEGSRHAAEEEHQELRRQYGDQAKELAEFWNAVGLCCGNTRSVMESRSRITICSLESLDRHQELGLLASVK
ncbi:hypothetical protein HPB47_009011 [Ixodes persulcatus]|uniref:Uncharacterized protein n=1 Tax=Ixodes persulcatus TaxID=34615 RepID=A0AC60R1L7_IXOPE|nr:hypothetical protein HPB47_009011 [Ixodes persulcatus]